jgi:hypothetical protein
MLGTKGLTTRKSVLHEEKRSAGSSRPHHYKEEGATPCIQKEGGRSSHLPAAASVGAGAGTVRVTSTSPRLADEAENQRRRDISPMHILFAVWDLWDARKHFVTRNECVYDNEGMKIMVEVWVGRNTQLKCDSDIGPRHECMKSSQK